MMPEPVLQEFFYYFGIVPARYKDNLRAENRLPTQADGAARSEFERAARSGTLRAPPTTTPPKPAEATLGFSSTGKTIDNSPGWRYSSDQKKRLFKFPIRISYTFYKAQYSLIFFR
jgi:hypothetical protein